jgi:DNA invertase Pin-like site-specific DNA recombinase
MNSAYEKHQLTLTTNGKIHGHHHDRLAIVYIRQSTLQQVERHSESTKLQYGLVEKAYGLGWPVERVVVIDDDLGRSGAHAEGRPGFQRLVAEVGLDRVGIVLGIEMSRLARSCRDWYQLLEVCALFRTLIGDTDGIYDPASYNDRLLLGLKGTMSEAELHVLKQRMIEGKNAKARRGELGIRPPMGYIKRPSGEIIKDLDQQAQSTIQLIFELFDKFATINAVLKYLAKNNIRLPYREISGLQKGELVWRRPNRTTLGNLFHNPIYAGAYAYGRHPTDPRKKKPGRPSTGRTTANQSDWAVLIKDKVPAYITWEQYERNRRQLVSNSTQGIGVPKKGSSLLSGLLVCGRCGLRMMTRYSTSGSKICYICCTARTIHGDKICQSLAGTSLDDLIVKQVLATLEPSALEISLQVAQDIEQERKNLTAHWENQLERTKYEVERVYRQYNSTEPENRLVARTLEKKWEEALSAEKKLKDEYVRFLADQPPILSINEREAIRKLASDIPALWSSSTTTVQERQEIIRLLIDRIIITVKDKTERVLVEIHWSGGYKSTSNFIRPIGKLEQLSYYNELLDRAAHLQKEGYKFKEIADVLNQEGWRGSRGQKEYTHRMVGTLLARRGITSHRKKRADSVVRMPNEFTVGEVSQKTAIPKATLYQYLRKGMLQARRATGVSHGGILLITVEEQEVKRLQSLKDQPKEWIYRSLVKKVD